MKRLKEKRSIDRILEMSAAIHSVPIPSSRDKAFLARQLVQVTLPHSDPGDIPIWTRKNGNLVLSIRQGWDHIENRAMGCPFGTIPRLLLFWITTEALRTKSRKLDLGSSMSEFMRELGLDTNGGGGGERGNRFRVKEQMGRLFRATISLDVIEKEGKSSGNGWIDMQVAPKGGLWWNPQEYEEKNVKNSWIELGEDFYNSIVAAPVPLDLRALTTLKNSPLALDIYCWATYKTYSLNQNNKYEQFIPWNSFMLQLGSEYNNIKDFKKSVVIAFEKVKLVYPGLNLDKSNGGFYIRAGKTSIISRTNI